MTVSDNLILDIAQESDTSSFQQGGGYALTLRDSLANTTLVTIIGFALPLLTIDARQILNKINSFKTLEPDWDSYGAIPPSSVVIEEAADFVRKADRNLLPFYFAAPGPNGEVVVEFKKGNKEAAVYFNPDGPADIVLSENNQVVHGGDLEPNYKTMLQFIHG